MAAAVVERAPEFRGWRIRTVDQPVDEGMIVTDHWLQAFGFSKPTRFNLHKIVAATIAQLQANYRTEVPNLDRQAKLWGDPFSERGSAPDIEFGEGLRSLN